MGIVLEAHNVKVLGSGEQIVVLGHGFGCDQSIWRYVLPHLVEDYRVILYDNMGAGTTNPDYFDFERYSTIEGFVHDVLAILEELQVKSCIFIGHSYSSMIAGLASLYRPDFFSKLIMISATPRLLNDRNYVGGFDESELKQMMEGMQSNYKAWCLGFAPTVVGCDMDSPVVQEFSRTLFNVRPDIALGVAKVKFFMDIRAHLPMIKVPCHILQSSTDKVASPDVAEYMHRNLGGPSVVEIMLTSGHLPQLSSPEIVVAAILKHLRLDITK